MANVIRYVALLSIALIKLHLQNVNCIETSQSFLTNNPFNEFDWKLSKALDKNEQKNFIVSPISVKLALGMLYLGVLDTEAGKEIEKVLHIEHNETNKNAAIEKFVSILHSLEQHKDSGYELNIGSKLFIDESAVLENNFKDQLLTYYNSSIDTVNFRKKSLAIKIINDWCSQITKGRIKQLIDEEETHEETIMMLLNAIYFRGLWKKPFPSENTKLGNFFISKNQSVHVQMMFIKEKFHYYMSSELNAEIIRLPYEGKKFAMYIIVPFDEDGLPKLTEKITPSVLAKAFKYMEESLEVNVHLHLPKFKFESTAILVPILKQLGINELFGLNANLNKIGTSPTGPLTVSNILQKSGIEVNEKGTTAYVSTAAAIDSRLGSDYTEVNVSRPFVFLIVDDTNDTIIFTGKVINPSISPDTNESIAEENPIEVSTGSNLENIQTQSTNYDHTILKHCACSDGGLFNIDEEKPNKRKKRDKETNPIKLEDTELERYNYFDGELLEVLIDPPQGNVVVSPASIKSTLALLMAGARGKTLEELKVALRLREDDEHIANSILQTQKLLLKRNSANAILNAHNKIYVAESEKLQLKYKNLVEKYSEIEQINFDHPEAAADTINNWVKNATNKFISNLVTKDFFDPSTKLFLINTIYFKAEWESEFDEKLTRRECFYDLSDKCQEVNLMSGEKQVNFQFSRAIDAKIVELPFKDSRYSMVILLPNARNGITKLIRDLKRQRINDLFSNMKNSLVSIWLPRTTIEFSGSLSNVLQKLEIKDIFNQNSNLTGMLDTNKPVSVKDVIHKAKIVINEKGAKAAAASAVQVVLLSAPITIEFRADHPFLFFIRDRELSGFLFEGLVASPDKVEDNLVKSRIDSTPTQTQKKIYYTRNISTTSPRSKHHGIGQYQIPLGPYY